MIGPRALLYVASLIVFAVAIPAFGPSGSRRDFEELRNKAMTAERSAQWLEAKRLWELANAIAPNEIQSQRSLATLAVKLGRPEEAFAWLEKAYAGCFSDPALGFANPAYLAEDQDYAPLHGDPRWGALLTTLKTQCAEGSAHWGGRQPNLDSLIAPRFKSHHKLAAAFDAQRRQFESDRWSLSFAEQHTRIATIRDQRVAALHRYLTDHPKAGDRADAAWDAIETRIWPRYIERLEDRWGELGTQILEEIDQFLRDYPGSSHCGQAAIDRAFVAFGVRPLDGADEIPWRDADMLALDRDLAEISRKYSGTTPGGLALAWRLILALPESGVTSEVRAMKGELDKEYGHNREIQKLMSATGGGAGLRISSVDDFDGTDLGGGRWTASSFKGKVTLISFWATWCGPCVGEIPIIRQALESYHDKGLAVLGVSLDSDDRAQFEGWLARNGVTWPQIWDGKGFSTALARQYEVRMIPFTVLVDYNGQVIGSNLRGGRLLARIDAMINSLNRPSSRDAVSIR